MTPEVYVRVTDLSVTFIDFSFTLLKTDHVSLSRRTFTLNLTRNTRLHRMNGSTSSLPLDGAPSFLYLFFYFRPSLYDQTRLIF